ncbi:iron complex transport system substrate-binding protein [Candidatus Magnetomoraceae bacterium gMMP-13]
MGFPRIIIICSKIYIIKIIIFATLFFTPLLSNAKMVTDVMGRTMKVPDNPKRIIALAPSITEIIFDLEQENYLKGVTQFSDFPQQAQKFSKVGSYVHLDLERIVALEPDLCIGVKDNPIEVVKRLNALQIPVYTVNPTNFDSVMDTILKIGKLLNCAAKAESLTKNLIARINHVKSKTLKIKHRPGVFFQIGISPIVSAGTDTFIHQLITLAGGKNLSKGPIPYPRFSKEQVLTLMPEIIIITSMAREGMFEQVKADWLSWYQLPAVKNKRIFLVDSDVVDRPTSRLVQGLEILAKLIHPEIFGNK